MQVGFQLEYVSSPQLCWARPADRAGHPASARPAATDRDRAAERPEPEHLKQRVHPGAGRVGFGYDMGATAALEGHGDAQHALETADAAAYEVELCWAQPYRQYKWWSKVSACCSRQFSWPVRLPEQVPFRLPHHPSLLSDLMQNDGHKLHLFLPVSW